MKIGELEINDEVMKLQDKMDDMVVNTAKELVELAQNYTGDYRNVDLLLTDFIANLVDCAHSIKYGFWLFEMYRLGEIDRKTLDKLVDKINIRPRYKKYMKETINELIKQEEREVG